MNIRSLALAAMALPFPAFAEVAIPDYLPDALVELSAAQVVFDRCEGLIVDMEPFGAYMDALAARMEADGLDAAAQDEAMKKIQTESETYFLPAYNRFMARHGADPEDQQAICAVVEAEMAEGTPLGKMVRRR